MIYTVILIRFSLLGLSYSIPAKHKFVNQEYTDSEKSGVYIGVNVFMKFSVLVH